MFLSSVLLDGVEHAYATFKGLDWEVPRLSSRLKALVVELEEMESRLPQKSG